MSMFRTELFPRPVSARDGSSALSRRTRRYGVSSARQSAPVLALVERPAALPAVHQEAPPALHRAA